MPVVVRAALPEFRRQSGSDARLVAATLERGTRPVPLALTVGAAPDTTLARKLWVGVRRMLLSFGGGHRLVHGP